VGGVRREWRERAQGTGVSLQLDSGGSTRACTRVEGPEVCTWDGWTRLLHLRNSVQEMRSHGNDHAWTRISGTRCGYLA